MNKYFELIDKYGLNYYFTLFMKNNSSINAPYHNLYHSLCVMYNAFEISQSYLIFTEEEKRGLLIACLFHDFGHSQGRLTDEYNIRIAIDYFSSISLESQETNSLIIGLIKATQHPSVFEVDDLSQLQKIISDADLMQVFENNYFQQNAISLTTLEFSLSLEEGLKISLDFYKNLRFHTQYAQNKYELHSAGIIADMNFLLESLK